MILLLLILLPTWVDGVDMTNSRRGVSTIFGGRRDKHRGGRSRCLNPPRRIRSTDWGIATRRGKCGDEYLVCLPKTGRCVIAPRIDAGPYGQKCKDNRPWFWAKRRQPGCQFRGIADLTPPVAKALGHDGWDVILLKKLHSEDST